MFNPINDTLEHIRRTYIPRLGMLVSFYNESRGTKHYVESSVSDPQYVGRIDMSEERLEEELTQLGFERNPLASLKTRAGTNEVEEGSFRWVPQEPTELDTEYQLHCIIYDGSLVPDADTGTTYVYAHWEMRWDRAPIAHYRKKNVALVKGRRMMREKLEEAGIGYDKSRPPRPER